MHTAVFTQSCGDWCQSARGDNSSGARPVSLVEAVVALPGGRLLGYSVRGGPTSQILLGFKSSEFCRA